MIMQRIHDLIRLPDRFRPVKSIKMIILMILIVITRLLTDKIVTPLKSPFSTRLVPFCFSKQNHYEPSIN